MKKINETLSISELMSSTVFGQKAEEGFAIVAKHSTIFSFWGDIVGKKFQKYTKPYAIKNSKIYVSTKSPALIQELTLLKSKILAKIHYKILKKNISNKYQILLESINKSKSLYPSLSYVDLLIRSLTHTDGAIYQDYVNSEQCEKLKNLVLEKLNIWARNTLNGLKNDLLPFDGNLLKHHMFYWILIFWFDNGDKESLAVFINAITESDKGLINFLNIIKQGSVKSFEVLR